VLTFEKVLGQPDPSILQLVVNKVFRSRTPSVIQSLVLVFAHLVNRHSPSEDPFELDRAKVGELVSFLCSFNVDNRIGLKVLVDKWLLQQSLFRGRLTKNATYLALARLFLLQEKTLDSLLVIGFNPSHSNISSVQAPLKIVSTLVRCLDHICGKGPELEEEEREEGREEQIEVGLSKFRDE
jgi:importin-9